MAEITLKINDFGFATASYPREDGMIDEFRFEVGNTQGRWHYAVDAKDGPVMGPQCEIPSAVKKLLKNQGRGRKPGRPREVTSPGEPPSTGNPLVNFRVSRKLHAWMQANGGTEWAREVVEREAERLGYQS